MHMCYMFALNEIINTSVCIAFLSKLLPEFIDMLREISSV